MKTPKTLAEWRSVAQSDFVLAQVAGVHHQSLRRYRDGFSKARQRLLELFFGFVSFDTWESDVFRLAADSAFLYSNKQKEKYERKTRYKRV